MTAPTETSVWSMYRAIVGIGALCALLIVTVFQTTAARIRDNQARALKAAVARVLPQAVTTVQITIDDDGRLQPSTDATAALPAFLGYDADGRLVGAALSAIGMGYQDNIRVLYAYSFEKQAIVGFSVLESKETPGLGDKIEKEPHFLANFEALDVSLANGALANAVVAVAQGEKEHPWQVDGITGATISSVAIAQILNDSANAWLPTLERDAPGLQTAIEEQP